MRKPELMHLYSLASLVEDFLEENEDSYTRTEGEFRGLMMNDPTWEYRRGVQGYYGYLAGYIEDEYGAGDPPRSAIPDYGARGRS